jgi:hypothetical protein
MLAKHDTTRSTFLITDTERAIPPSYGISLHSWQHVSIDIRSHRNVTMPHYLLNHLQGNSHTYQQCYRAMPQVMKTHIIEALTQLLAFTL